VKGSRLQLKFQASINTQAVVRALEDIRESKVFDFADFILTVASSVKIVCGCSPNWGAGDLVLEGASESLIGVLTKQVSPYWV
jgi:hypothetical protein